MAKTINLSICPVCESDLEAHQGLDYCPHCGTVLKEQKSKFQEAVSITHLSNIIREEIEQMENKTRIEPSKQILELRLVKFIRGCSDQRKIEIMQDALLLVKNLMHSRMGEAAFNSVIGVGAEIGEISESIAKYAKAGGTVDVTKLLRTTEGGSSQQGTGTASGAEPESGS